MPDTLVYCSPQTLSIPWIVTGLVTPCDKRNSFCNLTGVAGDVFAAVKCWIVDRIVLFQSVTGRGQERGKSLKLCYGPVGLPGPSLGLQPSDPVNSCSPQGPSPLTACGGVARPRARDLASICVTFSLARFGLSFPAVEILEGRSVKRLRT